MRRIVFIFTLFFGLLGPGVAQEPPAPQAINEVVGLKLPPSQVTNYDEGFVTVTADCKGIVRWLVLSTNAKVKFKVNTATPNEIDVAIPPYESIITLFAIGLVDGKLTEYARTDITVKGGIQPPVPPDPRPPDPKPPVAVAFPLHLTIIEDPSKRTPEIVQVIEDKDLRTKLKGKNILTRVYSVRDPKLTEYGFDKLLKDKSLPYMVLQDNDGQLLLPQQLSRTSAELLKILGPYVGGF
jgi:hypothetical protein